MSDGRKRLSGSQYKKKRLEKQIELQKQAGALHRFLSDASNSTENKDTSGCKDLNIDINSDLNIQDDTNDNHETASCSWQEQNSSGLEAMDSITESENEGNLTLSSDPGLWPDQISDSDRTFLVEKGPLSPLFNYDFPFDTNSSNRRFSSTYYYRDLENGEKILRDWLVYSVSKDSIFCFCCTLFDCKKLSSISSEGYRNWKNIGNILIKHELSKNHVDSLKLWLELKQRLVKCQTIDSGSQRLINAEIKYWNEVVLRIISVIKMLGKSSLAFRGSSDKLYEHNNGNFLKLIQLLAEFDPIMQEHVRRILNNKDKKANYLGKNIQNEIIGLLHDNVKSYIIKQVQKAKYYSVILDCTPDASKVEQMTFVVRYVYIDQFESGFECRINEHFLGFLNIERSTGKELSEVLLEELQKNGLKLENLRGQGYDNGSNMRGDKSGVQARIKTLNPRAFYVPCSNHSLNLVINDMVKASFEAANFFNMVQKLYTFFASSTFRWNILKEHITITLKPLSDTRWESRIDSLKPLRFQLGNVYDALLSIYENSEIDTMIRDEASGLLTAIKQFKFLCSIVIWHKILNHINPISKFLQTKGFDLSQAVELLNNSLIFFRDLRSDESFNTVIKEAESLASEIEIEKNFELTTPRHRVRAKKTKFFV